MPDAATGDFGYDLASDLCRMPEIDDLPTETLASLLQDGLRHHAAGRLVEAAKIYQRAYEEQPGDADALLLLGIAARQGGQYPAAVRLIAQAAEQKPDQPHIYFNLALACLGANDLDSAAEACHLILKLREGHGKTWALLGDIEMRRRNFKDALSAFVPALKLPSGAAMAAQSLGNQLCREHRYEEACRIYARGLRFAPGDANLHFSLGAAAAGMGKTAEARASYQEALRKQPNFPEAHLNLGNLFFDEKIFTAAASAYARAIALRPGYMKAHCNLGNALCSMGRYTRAIGCYERALEIDAEALAAQHNLGNALLHERDYVRAEECFRAVLEAEPERPELYNSLGNALRQQHRDLEAEACYGKAVSLKPDFAAAHINLANTLLQLGRMEEIKQHYQRGLELEPASPGGQYNYALLLLREGNYPEGWLRHEWRWDFHELHQRRRNFPQPQWRGSDLNGATILLHAEQGLGDTLQLVRYVPLVAARGGRVILEVQPRLQRLLANVEGVECIIARGDALPEFAYHCPLMSLPLAFRTTVETIPSAVPYVHADPGLIADAWQRYPRQDGRPRVGLAWAGNPKYKGDQQRSMTLEQLAPLAEIENAVFYSLQFGAGAEQIAATSDRLPVVDTASQHADFAETAAVAATLDLVISVDTSIAHLAGAMGLPVWVMLAHLADWRWMEQRSDNPWYPTTRLFRQPSPGDWTSVVANLRDALRQPV